MGRPRTPLGQTGKITLTPQVQEEDGKWITARTGIKPTRWRARTRYRGHDGRSREVTRFASTRARAETAVKAAVQRPAEMLGRDAGMHSQMTIEAAGAFWLEDVWHNAQAGRLSMSTAKQYQDALGRYVASSSIAALTLSEANKVATLDRWLRDIVAKHGAGAAKTARTVVSGIYALARRYEVVAVAAIRETTPPKRAEDQSRVKRAFTQEQRDHSLAVAARHPAARAQDCVDVIRFLAGTGARISEALAVTWDDVDLGGGTVLIRGTKTAGSHRRLHMPRWLIDTLAERYEYQGKKDHYVFEGPGGSAIGKPRDRRNVTRIIRQVLDEAGFEWATARTYRHTAATLILESGMPITAAADQLGHASPAMTANYYLGRGRYAQGAGAVL